MNNPNMIYGEAPDMTVYQREEGQRILIYIDDRWIKNTVVYDVLIKIRREKFIDFVGLLDFTLDYVGKQVLKDMNISYIDYELNPGIDATLSQVVKNMINNCNPTRAIIFCKDVDEEINHIRKILLEKKILVTIIR